MKNLENLLYAVQIETGENSPPSKSNPPTHIFKQKKEGSRGTLNEKKNEYTWLLQVEFESKSENKIRFNKTCVMLYVNLSKKNLLEAYFEKIKKPFLLYINS